LLPNGKVLLSGGLNSSGTPVASVELYHPATGTWSVTGSLIAARSAHTASLLPNGSVLVTGGWNNASGVVASAELYDPAAGTWSATASLATARSSHTATLLTSGQVLLAGGFDGNDDLASAELYDVGLGFSAAWQPEIATTSFDPSGRLVLTGTLFRGVSSASGGNGSQDSPTGYPLVQWRRLDNEQSAFLPWDPTASVSDTAAATMPLPPVSGYALITMFANGIPGASVAVVVPDYTVTITGDSLVVTDFTGHGDTLTLSEPSAGFIQFAAPGRMFSVNGGPPISDNSGTLSLVGITSITVNAGAGDDTVEVGLFTGALPPLAINGGDGTDAAALLSGSTVTITDSDGFTLNGSEVSTLLTINSDGPAAQTAALAGAGGVRKLGTGTLKFSENNAYTGNTTVSVGTLALAHASHNNLATSLNLIVESGATLDATELTGGRLDLASGQTLKGEGTLAGTLGVQSGATLSPGASPGILNSGSVVFESGSTFAVEIEGAVAGAGNPPGTGYDQLNVSGTVTLNGATLALSGSYVPAPGETFMIIQNDGNHTDPVTGTPGTFAGLTEGATITFNTVSLRISYAGGDGNDVTLRRETPPTAATLAYFRATAVAPNQVRLNWGMLVEVRTLGFQVDRRASEGGWERVTPGIIPSAGSDQRPHTYEWVDAFAPGMDQLTYRLVDVDWSGRATVIAEAAVTPAVSAAMSRSESGLTLTFHGQPGTVILVETATAVTGPWTLLSEVTNPTGTLSLALPPPEAQFGFFRARVAP
jgi:autotransporter-associated beta strand protein